MKPTALARRTPARTLLAADLVTSLALATGCTRSEDDSGPIVDDRVSAVIESNPPDSSQAALSVPAGPVLRPESVYTAPLLTTMSL